MTLELGKERKSLFRCEDEPAGSGKLTKPGGCAFFVKVMDNKKDSEADAVTFSVSVSIYSLRR